MATGGGRLSFALLGASIFLIIFLQLCVLANEIWGSGRELPLVFISWDVIKLWNDHVPTLFVVPRPELVVPSVSTACSDAQMVEVLMERMSAATDLWNDCSWATHPPYLTPCASFFLRVLPKNG